LAFGNATVVAWSYIIVSFPGDEILSQIYMIDLLSRTEGNVQFMFRIKIAFTSMTA